MKESNIQKSILDYLVAKRIFHWRQKNTGFKIADKHWIPSGTKGIPDILALHKGKFYGIEVKRPGGRLSEYQQEFAESIRENGGVAITAYSVDDVMRVL